MNIFFKLLFAAFKLHRSSNLTLSQVSFSSYYQDFLPILQFWFQAPPLKFQVKMNKNTVSEEKFTKKLSITSMVELGIKIRILRP